MAAALIATTAASALDAGEAVAATGVQRGLAVHLGASDGRLELDLALTGRFLVQGLTLDEAPLRAVRQLLESRGQHGPASVARVASFASLPFADHLVNLLIADLDGLGDRAPSKQEMMRVLSPRGVAYLKHNGRWEKTVKPVPAAMDEWTHFHHDAGGNPVSADEGVGPPTGLQWIAGVVGMGADPVSGYRLGDGRAVYEWEPIEGRKRSGASMSYLICRDAFSGVLLWAKRTAVRPHKTRPIVLANQKVYTFLEPEGPLVALDGATGEVVTTFDRGGRSDRQRRGSRADLNMVIHDGLLVQTAGPSIFVLDAKTGELKWKHTAADGTFVDHPTIDAAGGRLFVTSGATPRDVGRYPGADARVILAFDLKDGTAKWTGKIEKELTQISFVDGALYAFNCSSFIGRKRDLFIARLDPADGKVQWTVDPGHQGQLLDMAIVGGRIYIMSLALRVFDARTGAPVGTYKMPGNSRCDMSRASENFLLMSFGNFVDLSSDPLQLYRSEISRSTCGGGHTPGYGMMYYTPNRCHCFVSLRGFIAASREKVREPVADGVRLEKGDFSGAAKMGAAASGEDWPMYMGGPRRGSAVKTVLPDQPRILWQKTLAKRPDAGMSITAEGALLSSNFNGPITAATVSQGRVFVAVPEGHRVVSLDAADGATRWSFTADGRVDTPPTIHDGLCLFGCRDGRVYALDADTGKLAWRFLAAPYHRQIVAYNQLESCWPVFGSVLVADGVLVVAAGRHPETNGGIFVCGLDPRTGEQLWKQHIGHTRAPGTLGGKIPDEGVTTRRYGYNANKVLNEILISDGKLVAMTGLVLEAKTGKIVEEPQIIRKDGKIVNPWTYPMARYLDLGFRPPYRNQTMENYGGPGADHGSWLMKLEHPKLEVHGELIAFNDERVAVARAAGVEWAMWDTTKPFLQEGADKEGPRRCNSNVPPHWSDPSRLFADQPVKAMVLAGDKLVLGLSAFTGEEPKPAPAHPPSRAELRLLSTTDATTAAQVKLPAGVIQAGIAAARGRLFVSCDDGTLVCVGE